MNNEKEFWNRESADWIHRSDLFGSLLPQILDFIWQQVELAETDLNHKSVVINLGAGADNSAYFPKTSDEQIIAVDFAPEMLKRNPAKHKIEADLKDKLPLSDNSADLIASFFLMRYLSLEDQFQLLLEINRVLKPGGSAVIIDLEQGAYAGKADFDPATLLASLDQLNLMTKVNETRLVQTNHCRSGFSSMSSHSYANLRSLLLSKPKTT